MSSRPPRRTPALAPTLAGILLLSLCAFGFIGGISPILFASPTGSSAHTPASDSPTGGHQLWAFNAQTLCPSSGPTILGIQWNCVAILNLTEVGLILAGIGIVAYVFKDSDEAELPGEAAEVPVTVEEEEEYQRDRGLGLPYRPSGPPPDGDEQ